ncbi:MAG TPA: polysaccharide deacetylase family protein [Clostridiales bacterium]|nr:polysaccharide deacetylase family protein [Clostridiales bacterium]
MIIKREREIDFTNKKLVALTFDDGPNLTITPLILDKLETHGAIATFFLNGKYINDKTKEIMERQLKLGCELANHSWNHLDMKTLNKDEIKREVQKTNEIIYDKVGIEPAFFRPPYISVNDEMYDVIELPFINGINCNDWEPNFTAKERTEIILKKIKDGDIVLLHDFEGNDNTVNALDDIIEGLVEEEYNFVTVSQLFKYKNIDPNIKKKLWSNVNIIK